MLRSPSFFLSTHDRLLSKWRNLLGPVVREQEKTSAWFVRGIMVEVVVGIRQKSSYDLETLWKECASAAVALVGSWMEKSIRLADWRSSYLPARQRSISSSSSEGIHTAHTHSTGSNHVSWNLPQFSGLLMMLLWPPDLSLVLRPGPHLYCASIKHSDVSDAQLEWSAKHHYYNK